ncbi:MAG: hypothetical protein ISR41_00525 [Puniceicoccaceae bacterium]|nr:hypothetical protein [Puniceicoccaceae bacterium]
MSRSLLTATCAIAIGFVHPTHAIILVGGGNLVNTTNPGSGAPWDEVASVTNSSGTHSTSGSAIHVGGGYMLTANHVSLAQGYVSFDGSSTYQIASGSSVQVMSGTDVVDLKVFQITNNPGTSGVNLFPELAKGQEADFGAATHIGWGTGHNSADTSNPWAWGNSSTSEKRWGVNVFEGATIFTYTNGGLNYNFESIYTASDSDATFNEAAATLYDSGSGLFIKDGVDQWFLAGTIVTVSTNGSSTFAADNTADLNFAVRIAEYSDEIAALMTAPLAVPEPAIFPFLLGLVAMSAACGRRG